MLKTKIAKHFLKTVRRQDSVLRLSIVNLRIETIDKNVHYAYNVGVPAKFREYFVLQSTS